MGTAELADLGNQVMHPPPEVVRGVAIPARATSGFARSIILR
jgi:hypothetical protein